MDADEMFSPDLISSRVPRGVFRSAGATALLGDAAVLIWNDVVDEGRDLFYRWHDLEHIPERIALPGFRRGRRFARSGHSPAWLTMYEAADLEALTSPEYLERLDHPTPGTRNALQYFRNTSRAVCRLAYSTGGSTGGHMLALRIELPAEYAEELRFCIRDRLFPAAMAITGVLACHLFESDQRASHIDTAESSTRAFDVPSAVILCEATRADAAEAARKAIEGEHFRRLEVLVRPGTAVYDLEISRLAAH